MPLDPFPSPGPDGEEPDGSGTWPAAGADDEVPPEGAEQGLYVCLPAEELTLAGFAQNGQADTMAPGALLATVVDTVTGQDGTGLAGLSDDQLTGVLSAARRLESRAAWTQLAALAEFARRRPATEPADAGLAGFSDFAADELAGTLKLTGPSAAAQMAYACAVAKRLPKTFAALAAGLIHPVHVRIIEDETAILSEDDAALADAKLAELAQSKTFGELRYAAHRLILTLDPEAAARRKEQARQDAHVRRFREDSGNAGMIARELPPDEILASWQHVEQRALDLRAAGVPGTLQELRVRAFLDLLQERDARTAPSTGQAGSGEPGPQDGPGDGGSSDSGNGDPGPGPQDGPAGTSPGGGAARQPGTGAGSQGPSLAALVTITVPLATLLDQSGIPGEAGGFGLLDPGTAQDLMDAAARSPATRWCVTALHPDGTAAAHACAPGRHRSPPDLRNLTFNAVIRGPCHHAQAHAGYRPGRKLQHLVTARNARCTAAGCNRPAARCDLDHTTPWHHGGATCECNLAPLCKR